MTGERTAIPTCREVVDRLAEWSEGRLADDAAGPLARHLELCPPCAHVATTYRAVARLARAALAVEMPADARERLRRALAARVRGGN